MVEQFVNLLKLLNLTLKKIEKLSSVSLTRARLCIKCSTLPFSQTMALSHFFPGDFHKNNC